jgi:tetratricopeptide (TPR) repeat protein
MRLFILPTLIGSLFAPVLISDSALAQSDMDRRNTEVVQSMYLRTLSVVPSEDLVREAQNALDMSERSYGATDGRTADMAVNLGRALNGTGQYAAAVAVLQSALSIYEDESGDPNLRSAIAHYELGRALDGAGDSDAAVTALTDAYFLVEPILRRLSTNADFIKEALLAAGGAAAVNAAESRARSIAASESTSQPKATLRIPPIYPPDVPGDRGWVLLDYRLWPDGAVRDVVVLAADPPMVFDISAVMALSNWRFEPENTAGAHHQLSIVFDARE